MGAGLIPVCVPLSSPAPSLDPYSARWDGQYGRGVDFDWRPSSQGPCLVALDHHHESRLAFTVGSRNLCCLLQSQARVGREEVATLCVLAPTA